MAGIVTKLRAVSLDRSQVQSGFSNLIFSNAYRLSLIHSALGSVRGDFVFYLIVVFSQDETMTEQKADDNGSSLAIGKI